MKRNSKVHSNRRMNTTLPKVLNTRTIHQPYLPKWERILSFGTFKLMMNRMGLSIKNLTLNFSVTLNRRICGRKLTGQVWPRQRAKFHKNLQRKPNKI